MSQFGNVNAQARDSHGKGAARRLRAKGMIPAVVYGGGKASQPLELDGRALMRSLDPERRFNTLLSLVIDGAAAEHCVVSEAQTNALTGELVHADLLRVDPKMEIERKIAVKYTGRSPGVAAGGKLRTYRRSVKVAAAAENFPVAYIVDMSNLQAGQTIRISDIAVEGMRLLEPTNAPLAYVAPPKVKVEAAPTGKKGKKK